jgi:Arc/MetJ-type ribon-helix-helix transcriptional regulator
MEIRLKNPKVEQFIESQVESGHFPDRESVVLDAVSRMMEEQISLTSEDIEEIGKADEEIERGEFIEYSEFAAKMREKFGITKKK